MAKYKVQTGDSLPKIAAKFQTTVGRLKELNNIFSVSRGQEINLPTSKAYKFPNIQYQTPIGPVTPPPVRGGVTQYNSPIGPVSPYKYNAPYPNYTNSIVPNGPVYQYQNPAGPVQPVQPLNTTWPPRPQVAPNARNMYLSQFPGQGTATNARADYMAQFPGQGTMTPQTKQYEYLSQFPGRREAVKTIEPVSPTAELPTYNPNYPPALRPSGQITTDNYGDWVAYWNYEATKPASARIPAPPQVMTKAQIWEMKKRKAVARREALAAEQASQFTPVFVGSSVQNLALRTG